MARVREVEFSDIAGVTALHRDFGWPTPTLQDWQRLWIENPALDGGKSHCARGWVLEEGSRIVGFVCNLAQSYWFGGRKITAAAASGMVVAPDYRGESIKLIMVYVQQPHVHLLLNTTAAPQTSKIFEFFKFRRIPHSDYDISNYWVLQPSEFLKAGLLKKGISKNLSAYGGVALAPLLWVEAMVRRRVPTCRRSIAGINVVRANEVDNDFDDLWRRKLDEGGKLLADRSSGTLRWHFAAAGRAFSAKLICARNGSQLTGYAALIRQDSPYIGLKRAYLADIFVERDEPATIRLLVAAAIWQAKVDGAAMIEAVGFPENIRRILRESHPFELRNESWPFLYRERESWLEEALKEQTVWYPCLYDGDGSI
jgi:hypothetical protein